MRLQPTTTGFRIRLKVVPGASHNSLAGWLGDRLKIRVAAPPEHGRANAAACLVLAKALGLNARSVQIVAGQTCAEKTAEVRGLSAEQAAALLPD